MSGILAELHHQAKGLSPEEWCNYFIDFASGKDTRLRLPAFPEPDIQKITNNAANAATMRVAAQFYDIFDQELRENAVESTNFRVLDYGAGWGRITRLLIRSVCPSNIYAVDVDDRLVRSGATLLPDITFLKIESGKALPFDDNFFDVVISNSVFSHLSEKSHRFYINELSRILSPRGLLMATTLSTRHYDAYMGADHTKRWITKVLGAEMLVRQKLADGEFVFGDTGRWKEYGIAILPEGFTQHCWKDHFEILRIRTDYGQDINLARKI